MARADGLGELRRRAGVLELDAGTGAATAQEIPDAVLAGHVLTTRATAAAGPRDGHGSAYDATTGQWLAEGAPHHVPPTGTGAWQLMGFDGEHLIVVAPAVVPGWDLG